MKKIIILICVFVVFIQAKGIAQWSCTTYTPNFTKVHMTCYGSEPMSNADIANLDSYTNWKFPHATILSSSSGKYNCHSYAWYWSSTSNSAWMESPNDNKYWNDGSYVSTTWGTHLSYSNDDHSGRAAPIPYNLGYTFSKWGKGPLMAHYANYAPYNTSGIHYYKR